MAEILNVWRDSELVGYFERVSKKRITFTYEESASDAPISLSIPRSGSHTKNAPRNLLDNFLPDNKHVRESWSKHFDIPNTPFDLLTHMGQDVAGALVLLPDGMSPQIITEPVQLADEDEIADRIMSLRRNPDAWLNVELLDKRVRMSLAGAQGKFTMSKVEDQWFWSSVQLPSTHIFKPAVEKFHNAHEIESGTLRLARMSKIDAPDSGVIEFLGQETYVVERFDREVMKSGVARRLPIEDFAQSFGRDSEHKYGITAKQIVTLLRSHSSEEQVYTFIRMLAFNTMVGNSDAHGKNYSVRLEKSITLTPIYDSLVTRAWPDLESKLAMRISGAKYSQEVQIEHWLKFARVNALDQDRVVHIVREVAETIKNNHRDVFLNSGVEPLIVDRISKIILRSVNRIIQ